jgi:hypothetical protein
MAAIGRLGLSRINEPSRGSAATGYFLAGVSSYEIVRRSNRRFGHGASQPVGRR